jgi:hypothetical protein
MNTKKDWKKPELAEFPKYSDEKLIGIIKGAYEKRYSTQKYEGSTFQATYEKMIIAGLRNLETLIRSQLKEFNDKIKNL